MPAVTPDLDPRTVAWVMTRPDLQHLCVAVERAEEVVWDLETTGLDEHAAGEPDRNGGVPARVVLSSMTLPTAGDPDGMPTTWVLPLSHPDSPWLTRWRAALRVVAQAVRAAGKPLANQNVKFDSRWIFAHTGVDLSGLVAWDTQVSSHLLDENSSTKLKERAPVTFGIPPWDEFDFTIPGEAERVPLFDLGLYAARDTYWTWRLKEHHREQMFLAADAEHPVGDEVEEARLGRLAVWCAMPAVAALTAVEQRGIRLDTDWTEEELTSHRAQAEQITKRLAHRYTREDLDPDKASFAPTSHWFVRWADAAVDADDLRVAAMTPTGKPQWTKGVLVRQAREGSEVAATLLELRGLVKRSEYLAKWLTVVTGEGLIHASYHAGSVATGRTSSSDPNMQQVTAALRPAFLPREGYLFADLDYSQIELRVVALVSRCQPMLQAFRDGRDLHRLLASRITTKHENLVTAQERQAGKSANFGLCYGMGVSGFRDYAETQYGVSFTVEEAEQVYRTYFDTWTGLREWHAATAAVLHRTGQVISPVGRIRRLPEVWTGSDYLVSGAERSAINAPVQGLASDMLLIAAASIEGTLPGHRRVEGARIVATVHDNVLVEVPEDDWERVARACQQRMLAVPEVLARLDCRFDVPLAVEVKVGTRWGQADVATFT